MNKSDKLIEPFVWLSRSWGGMLPTLVHKSDTICKKDVQLASSLFP